MIYSYNLYLNCPGDNILSKKTREVCYRKGLVSQSEIYDKLFKICQKFKNRNTLYGRLPPNNTLELKLWDTVHVDLIGTYSKSIRQKHQGGTVIRNNSSLTCMTIIDPSIGWFDIVEKPMFDLEEVTLGHY